MIHVLSPAKLNLFLHVTGKRDDGYHELFTLMACIDLCDDMYFEFNNQEGVFVQCSHPEVPEDASNLAHRAASLFFDTLSVSCTADSSLSSHSKRPAGVMIKIKKKIPVGGGLGGGSSNAATVLKTMNDFFGRPFSTDRLLKMALMLGADVPFFINGLPAFASGVGEKLSEPVSIFPCHALVLCPRISSSTARVYKNLNLIDCALTKTGKFNINQLSKFHGRNEIIDSREYLANDLEKSALELYPDLKRFRDELNKSISEKALMTGSGSCFFVLFEDHEGLLKVYEHLADKWQKKDVMIWPASFINSADELVNLKKCS